MKTNTTHNYSFILVFIVFLLTLKTQSQTSPLKLIGFSNNQEQGVNVVKWNAGETIFNSSYPTNIQGILLGSSTFDSASANYFAKVLDNTNNEEENKLFKFNANTETISLFPAESFFNGGSEVDMETGLVYTYDGDADNNVFLNQYNSQTGIATNLGIFNFNPNTNFFPDSACYDSNNKKYYFLILEEATVKLVSVSVDSQPLDYTITPLAYDGNSGNIGLEYSNETNTIYAMYSELNPINNSNTITIGSLNPLNGELTAITNLDNVIGYQLSNRTYDQETKSFVFIGLNNLNNFELLAVNTETAAINTYPLPEGLLVEIESDNSQYATTKYGTLKNNTFDQAGFTLFPNPASTTTQVSFSGIVTNYYIADLLGKTTLEGNLSNHNIIDVSTLSKGVYIFSAIQNDKVISKKIVIK